MLLIKVFFNFFVEQAVYVLDSHTDEDVRRLMGFLLLVWGGGGGTFTLILLLIIDRLDVWLELKDGSGFSKFKAESQLRVEHCRDFFHGYFLVNLQQRIRVRVLHAGHVRRASEVRVDRHLSNVIQRRVDDAQIHQ